MTSSRCTIVRDISKLVWLLGMAGCQRDATEPLKDGGAGGSNSNLTSTPTATAGRNNLSQGGRFQTAQGGTESGQSKTGGATNPSVAAAGVFGTGVGGTSQYTATSAAGAATLVNPAPGSKPFVGVNFWRIDWEGSADFFSANVDWATTENPWQPQLLSDLAPFGVLRFMDWNLANDDPNPQASWSSRKLPTQSQSSEPIAFEWQVDLCNRSLKDCWLTIPIQADASFHRSLAQLTHETLDPRLRLYVELSNEVWNGSFPQAKIARTQADQLGLPATPNSCCTTDTIKTANAYVYDAVRMFEQFESVFGKASPRLVKVLSGQSAWDGPCQVHVQALKDTALNPNGTMPTVYAIAPYFGGTTISALQSDIASETKGVATHVACAGKLGLPVIGYEGGSDSYAAGNGCVTLQHDPGMYDLYQQYYDALVAAGMMGPIMQYTEVGKCWGLKEKTSDTLTNSPKYRAVVDWIAAHP